MAIQDINLGTILENGEDGDVARTAFTKVNSNFDDLDTRVTALEALDIGDVTSVNGVTAIDGNVELTPEDIGAATAAQGAKADTAIQPSIFTAALDNKVDKVVGYQLSQEDFTTSLKTKLEGLDDAGFQGFYVDLASLQSAAPVGQAGWWAFIDANNVTPISIAVWNATAEVWEVRPGGGGGGSMTPEQIKTAYESNPDTNAFTDAEKTKLGGIEAGAQVNVATNISQGVRTGTSVSVNSSTGTGAILTGASDTEAGIMVASDKSKLDGIEAGAQVNVATNLAQGARTGTTAQIISSTGTSATLTSASTSEAGLLSATDKTKLDGVATGATANQTDSYLLDRSNHTGTQTSSTISDFSQSVRSTLLTGLSLASSTDVVATDNLLEAIGKLQAQLDTVTSAGVFTKEYVSTLQTYVNGGFITLNHGLAVIPKMITLDLICQTAEGGYSSGDIVQCYPIADAADASYNFSCKKSSSQIVLRVSPNGIILINGTSGAGALLTPTNWRIVVRGFA